MRRSASPEVGARLPALVGLLASRRRLCARRRRAGSAAQQRRRQRSTGGSRSSSIRRRRSRAASRRARTRERNRTATGSASSAAGADQAGVRAAVRVRERARTGRCSQGKRLRRRDPDRSDRRDVRSGLQRRVQLSDLERPVLSRSRRLGLQGRQLRRAMGTLEGIARLERCGRRVRHAGLDARVAAIGQQPVRQAQGEQGQYAGLQQLEQQSARQPALLRAEAATATAWSRCSTG